MNEIRYLHGCLTLSGLFFALIVTNVCHGKVVDKSDEKATELSVAPSTHREFPAERPDWVDAAADLDGESHRWPVTSTPCRSESLCDEGLKVNMRAAVETYIESITGDEDSSGVVTLDDEWINRHRDKTKYYLGIVKAGDEPMYESATILQFDKDDRKLINDRWRRHQIGQRLAVLGVVSGGAISVFVGIAAALSVVTRRAEQRVVR